MSEGQVTDAVRYPLKFRWQVLPSPVEANGVRVVMHLPNSANLTIDLTQNDASLLRDMISLALGEDGGD